jgi:hypothetical protein
MPRRKATEANLRRRLESLSAPFSNVVLRERPRSFDLALPAHADYTGSVASRAAQAAFEALGCTDESTFTIYSYGGYDPYYMLRITENAAEATSGFVKRWFERRAKEIRSSLPGGRNRPGGPERSG